MILYHGSLEVVDKPEIRISSHTLDYGYGFYTTTSREQAVRLIHRRMQVHKSNCGYLNLYEFDETVMSNFNCLIFDKADEAWVDFVMNNRMQKHYVHAYDIVYGPVANDHVYTAFSLYEGKVLSKKALIEELRTYNLVDQYLFHTEASLKTIKFIKAEEVR